MDNINRFKVSKIDGNFVTIKRNLKTLILRANRPVINIRVGMGVTGFVNFKGEVLSAVASNFVILNVPSSDKLFSLNN